MKKIVVTVILSVMTISSLCACGDNKKQQQQSQQSQQSTQPAAIIVETNADSAVDREIKDSVIVVSDDNVTVTPTPPQRTTPIPKEEDNEGVKNAEDLLNHMSELDYDYVSADMNLVLATSKGDTRIDMSIESDGKLAYAVTKMQGVNVESWIDINNNTTYSKVDGGDGWVKGEAMTKDYTNMNTGLTAKDCENIRLNDKNSDYYEVTCTIPFENAVKVLGDQSLTDSIDMSSSDIKYNATYRFDKETENLIYCKINIIMSSAIQRKLGMEVNAYYIECTYKDINTGKTLELPNGIK